MALIINGPRGFQVARGETASRQPRAPADAAQAVLRTAAGAWRDLHGSVDAAVKRSLGLVHQPLAGGHLFAATALNHLMLNRLTLAPPTALGEAMETFKRLAVQRYLLSFDAGALPEALAQAAPRGLVRFHRPWETLLRTGANTQLPDAPPVPGLRIRRAILRDAPALGALLCEAFDMPAAAAPLFTVAIGRPRWLVLVAERDGDFAGAGLLFMSGSCAYLALGATAASHRRQGIQRALVTRRVRWAMAKGAKVIGSETGTALPGEPNPSWYNLQRAGLTPVHVVEHLCPQGSAWKPPTEP